jgi:hypothetical protein
MSNLVKTHTYNFQKIQECKRHVDAYTLKFGMIINSELREKICWSSMNDSKLHMMYVFLYVLHMYIF